MTADIFITRPKSAPARNRNISLWLKILALPPEFRFAAGKRLRLHFLNVAARITTSGRQLFLNLPRTYRYLKAFIRALNRIRALPAFG